MKMPFRVSFLLLLGVYLWGQVASEGLPDPSQLDPEQTQDEEQWVKQGTPIEANAIGGSRMKRAAVESRGLPDNPDGSIPAGKTYIRWGKTSCRDGAELVYEGVMAGKKYNEKGSGTNYLCLHKFPEFLNPSSGAQGGGYIWGTEGETIPKVPTFIANSEVPCAVCMAPGKHEARMMPGIKNCPIGQVWEKEYQGYLASGHYTEYATEFICLDYQAEGIPRTGSSHNPSRLFQVEARCSGSGGGIPCPPYADGYEVTCVVCSI